MSIRLPYLGKQFISPFSANPIKSYGDKLLEDIIPATKLKIDPYWHFLHLYSEEYIWSDLRLWQMYIDGVNVSTRNYSNRVNFYGTMSNFYTGPEELRDFLYRYEGNVDPASNLNTNDWHLINGTYPEVEAKDGRLISALNLTNLIPGMVNIQIKFTNSTGDSVFHPIGFELVRAPIYSYHDERYKAATLSQAVVDNFIGPIKCSKWENFTSNLAESLVLLWKNVGTLSSIGEFVQIVRKKALEELAKRIMKTASEQIKDLIVDQVIVQSIGSMTQNFMYPYELIRKDIREFEESFYGRHMMIHGWVLDCHEYDINTRIYKKLDTIPVIAITVGAMSETGFVPKLTRWNVHNPNREFPDEFQRNEFISWLAPYEYQFLPLQEERLRYDNLFHPASHGAGLLFPVLQGLPNQPDLLGYHKGFSPPK